MTRLFLVCVLALSVLACAPLMKKDDDTPPAFREHPIDKAIGAGCHLREYTEAIGDTIVRRTITCD